MAFAPNLLEPDRIALARLILAGALLRERVKRHRWLRTLLYRLEASIVLLCWWVFRALPVERAAALGRLTLGLLGPRSAKAGIVNANLSIAFPTLAASAIDALARRNWRNLGLVFGEYPHLDRIARVEKNPRVELVDLCGLDAYRRRERAAIFFGAHLSNFEMLALALARDGVPLLALQAPLQNPQLGKLMDRARIEFGCKLVSRGDSMLARGLLMRELVNHVREGGSLGMLLDLAMQGGAPVPFFDQPMSTSLTPVRMAERYGCDIVPVRTERLGVARFRVTAYPPIILDRRGADEEDRAIAATRQLNALMENWIREQPDEWMCANRRWEKTLYRSLGLAHR